MSKVSFNNKNNVFSIALKEKVDYYFTSKNIKPTGNYKIYIKAIILLSLAFSFYTILVFFTPSVGLSLFICALLGGSLAGIGFNVMHDSGHGSFSKRKWVNNTMVYSLNIMGASSYLWKIKHNINHHTYTNVQGMDDDIDIEPWIRTNQNQPKFWYHRFQHVYWALLYTTTYLFWVFYQDFDKYFRLKVANSSIKKLIVREHIIFWATKILYVVAFIILPIFKVGLIDTIIGYSLIAVVTGFIISIVFQLAHVVEGAHFPEVSNDANQIEEEWAVHQIKTTANFSTKSKIVSWFTGGLNFQIEHHLFPKISHIHYPQISKLVKETCEQFNIKYIEFPSVLAAVRSHVSYLKVSGR